MMKLSGFSDVEVEYLSLHEIVERGHSMALSKSADNKTLELFIQTTYEGVIDVAEIQQLFESCGWNPKIRMKFHGDYLVIRSTYATSFMGGAKC